MLKLTQDEIAARNKASNRAEYDALPGLNQSTARLFRRSIAHGDAALKVDRNPTAPMILGTLVHKAVLEPTDWATYHAVPEDAPSRPSDRLRNAKKPSPDTVAAVAYWDDLFATYGDRVVAADTHKAASDIAASVVRAMGAYGIVPIATEVGLCAEFGIPIRGSLDIIAEDGIIYDIKTTSAAATRDDWGRDLERDPDLALQVAWYCLLFRENFGAVPTAFRHIVVETKAPYAVQVFEADEEIKARGVEIMLAAIDRYRAYQSAIAEGVQYLPAYPVEVIKVSPWKPAANTSLQF
jgi:exodeoxyribonuclease VIII